MRVARYAFGFISVVLFWCAMAMYFTHRGESAAENVAIALAVLGAITMVVAWWIGLRDRSINLGNGESGDSIDFPGVGHGASAGADCGDSE